MTALPTNEGKTPCATADPELFDPLESQTDKVRAAKSLCFRCPLRVECREWALEHDEVGIWGGMTETERREVRERGLRHELGTRMAMRGAA